MQRLAFSKLVKWKESADRKPLLVKGVRQCGKTFLLREFGARNYSDVAYFNFEGNTPLQERFQTDLNVARIVDELGVLRNKKIVADKTLIIFDEIQFCNAALTSLKYFAENAPEYHVACAGSLLGIALSKPLSFPVGKVNFLTLRPMSFFEFLIANGENMLCDYILRHDIMNKISELFAAKLEQLLREYYICGGMPEVVKKWVETKDVAAVEEIQARILDGYELDFAKHASGEFTKLTAVWRSIPAQLSKDNQKFIFSRVKQGSRAKDLEDALEWLVSAGLVYKVEKISKPAIPLSGYADSTYFKLYMSDIGLLRKMAGLPAGALLEKNDNFTEFKGALTENYVLCELVQLQDRPPYFWRSENTAEVDFVSQFGSDIVPIEVKSERNTKAKSLAVYRKLYSPRVSLKLSMKNISPGDVLELLLYMLWAVKWPPRGRSPDMPKD